MAISFVGSGAKAATVSSTTTFTFSTDLFDASNTAGPTLQQDDWVYVVCAKGHQAAAVSVPTITTAGYAQVGTSQYGNDSDDISLAVYRKKMGATPDATVVMASAALQQEMIVFVFRGVDTTTPDDATPVGANGINGGQADPGSITPVTAGAWIFAAGGGALNAALNTYSNITGFSSTTNHFQRVQNSASVFVELGAAIKTDWTSGAVDPAAFGGTANVNARSGWAGLTMALKPARAAIAAGLAAEAEAGLAPRMAFAASQATEAETALAPRAAQGRAAGFAAETEAGLAPALGLAPGRAVETETALAPAAAQGRAAGRATETEAALAPAMAFAPGRATESGTAIAAGAVQSRAAALATEIGQARPANGSRPAVAANENDNAVAPGAVQSRVADFAAEADSAVAPVVVRDGPVPTSRIGEAGDRAPREIPVGHEQRSGTVPAGPRELAAEQAQRSGKVERARRAA